MVKIALLIGISEYGNGFHPLPGTLTDIQAMERVLKQSEMGGFDQVKLLPNPGRQQMAEAIEELFVGCQPDDLILLYFSGHGIKLDSRDGSDGADGIDEVEGDDLYFASRETGRDSAGRLKMATALSAYDIKKLMRRSASRRQVLILDCCFSGAFAKDMMVRGGNSVPVDVAQLGGEGRAVLTSSAETQPSFEDKDGGFYTRYIVEGVEKGSADTDNDGWITVDELHEFAKRKTQEAKRTTKPEIYAAKEGYKIQIAKSPKDDPLVQYRKEAEKRAEDGKFTLGDLAGLKIKCKELKLSSEQCELIKAEVLQPYREYEAKLCEYEEVFSEEIKRSPTIDTRTRDGLLYFQEVLGITPEDMQRIETQIISSMSKADIPEVPLPADSTPPGDLLEQGYSEEAKDKTSPPKPTKSWDSGTVLGSLASLLGAIFIINIFFIPPSTPLPPHDPGIVKAENTENGTKAEALFKEAHQEFDQGNLRGSVEKYTQAIKLNPDYAEAYKDRGVAYHGLRDKQSALEDYNKAIQLQPNYARAYNNRGLIRFDLGDKKAAIEDYNRAIQFQPDLFQPYNNRGLAHYALGDKQAAIADYSKAIQLKSDYIEAYLGRGDAYLTQGINKLAISDYGKVVELNADSCIGAYINRGLAYFRQGQFKDSIADEDKAINLYNNLQFSNSALSSKQFLYTGNDVVTQFKFSAAIAYNIRGGAIFELLGNKDAAIENYNQAIELNPAVADPYYNRGLAYSAQGKKATALKDFQKAADLYQKQGNTKLYNDTLARIKENQV